jgi:hypothetical protein
MRRALTAAAGLACVIAAGCGGGSSAPTTPPPPKCAGVTRPITPLLIRLRRPPTVAAATCLGRTYTNVVAPAWPGLPSQVQDGDPSVHVFQERVLQYGFTPCSDCPRPGLDLADVRRDHPDWILKDASGADVHPPSHPEWVMFDISNPNYLQAWATAVEAQLGDDGWTGVELVDAGNLPAWTNPPIDPNTGQDMTVADHARYLAEAMAEVRGGLKSNNFAVIAQNLPFTIIDPHQIASSDAVSVERGFARLQGSAWTSLYTYFEAALDSRVGAWVWDGGRLDHQQRVFGLASYLLVSGLWSGYAVSPGPEPALYRLNPGVPSAAPIRQGAALVREFDSGAVAVNPGAAPATVQLPGENSPLVLPPGGAVIDVTGRLTSSFS